MKSAVTHFQILIWLNFHTSECFTIKKLPRSIYIYIYICVSLQKKKSSHWFSWDFHDSMYGLLFAFFRSKGSVIHTLHAYYSRKKGRRKIKFLASGAWHTHTCTCMIYMDIYIYMYTLYDLICYTFIIHTHVWWMCVYTHVIHICDPLTYSIRALVEELGLLRSWHIHAYTHTRVWCTSIYIHICLHCIMCYTYIINAHMYNIWIYCIHTQVEELGLIMRSLGRAPTELEVRSTLQPTATHCNTCTSVRGTESR